MVAATTTNSRLTRRRDARISTLMLRTARRCLRTVPVRTFSWTTGIGWATLCLFMVLIPSADAQVLNTPETDLAHIVRNRRFDVRITGAGLEAVTLTMKDRFKTPSAVVIRPPAGKSPADKAATTGTKVVIPPGTVFRSGSSKVQNMVVIEERTVFIPDGGSAQTRIPSACINMRREEPSTRDALTHDGMAKGTLLTLLRAKAFSSAPSTIRQYAIWTVVDNPERSGYVGIQTRSRYSFAPSMPYGYSGGGQPSDETLKSVRDLLSKAGLSPRRYRALRGLK